MTIEEKYNIVYIDNKRYYIFDMLASLPVLENVVPYYFKYKDIEIYETSWNRMTIKILEEIDKLHSKSEDELLRIKYSWSKQDVFSKYKKTNHTPFKNLFLNTNHSATHAMMSIQCLLKSYDINLTECYFLVRKHPVAEPLEVKQFYRNKTIFSFKNCLNLNGFKQERIENVMKNFDVINKFLQKVSIGFIDFFLFDDYYYFSSYKSKTLEEVQKTFQTSDKNYIVIKRCLSYLDDFYKNPIFYEWMSCNEVDSRFVDLLEKEINFLFDKLNSNIIVADKLYARLAMLYEGEMTSLGPLNNSNSIYKICSIMLRDKFHFREPYISTEAIPYLRNDQIIRSYAYSLSKFSTKDLSDYADKMHLKKIENYLDFIEELSDEYVQVEKEKFISKTILNIDTSMLNTIQNELNFYIKSFGNIDSEKYCGYAVLPKVKYEWNKYLLIGIIRSFFGNIFEIEYVNKNTRQLSYIISIK